ncbi:MAG: S8 family serine peptidase [Solirubrobacteraceae bacterium]
MGLEPEHTDLPAWSLDREAALAATQRSPFPLGDAREWAWGGATGAGVRVCVIDSGIDGTHPLVGGVDGAVFVAIDADEQIHIDVDREGDLFGHGTACAGIIRSLAPGCEIYSVRTLGRRLSGKGAVLLAGLKWAIEQRYDIINLSLSMSKASLVEQLRELADEAYFANTLIVAAAHNMPVVSYPWRFPAVVSVGSHSGSDPLEFYANPTPPVEFLACGVEVEMAWLDHATLRATGNSFATPHIAGIAARILSKHPGLTPFEVKSLLRATAGNVRSEP